MKEIYVERKGVRNPPKQSNKTEKQTMKKTKSNSETPSKRTCVSYQMDREAWTPLV